MRPVIVVNVITSQRNRGCIMNGTVLVDKTTSERTTLKPGDHVYYDYRSHTLCFTRNGVEPRELSLVDVRSNIRRFYLPGLNESEVERIVELMAAICGLHYEIFTENPSGKVFYIFS